MNIINTISIRMEISVWLPLNMKVPWGTANDDDEDSAWTRWSPGSETMNADNMAAQPKIEAKRREERGCILRKRKEHLSQLQYINGSNRVNDEWK